MSATNSIRDIACIRFVRRPDSAGWWYDTKTERWRWCFEDPGMGFCARESKSDAGHFWRVSNYNPAPNRWYGPWSPPNAPHQAGREATLPGCDGSQFSQPQQKDSK